MPTATLYITPYENHPGEYLVVIDGVGFYNAANKIVSARVRGDDEWFDDRLFSVGGGNFDRVSQEGYFNISTIATASQLNEDWGQDEIFAIVEMQGGSTYRTNTIRGNF